jgi:hypothetical protein
MRGFLDKDIYETIVELGTFFSQLCSRTLDKDVLAEMKKEIPIILVKLEIPPGFLRGPVQFGWMYPIER